MRILLAISGGIDSMYLAGRAPELFPGAAFAVAHCNFGLRGKESDADEAFVREWCSANGLPIFCERFDTAGYAGSEGVSIEMAARVLRYRWFSSLCAKEGFDAVAVAHNANDNAETFVLNLLRGTGTRGLRGMAADTVVEGARVLRPMLAIPRKEIEAWMAAGGRRWREDRTNADPSFKRNRVRTEVFPSFAEINPSFLKTLERDMAHIREVDDIAERYWQEAGGSGLFVGGDSSRISTAAIRTAPHGRYLLVRALEGLGFQEDTIDAIYDLVVSDRTLSGKTFESTEAVLTTTSDELRLSRTKVRPAPERITVEGPGEYGACGSVVKVETMTAEGISPKCPEGVQVFDASALLFPFVICTWRPGDWMKPLGMKGRKKLSDMFVDLKWSRDEKERALVIIPSGLEEGHVAALVGARTDRGFKVSPETETIIKISITQQ